MPSSATALTGRSTDAGLRSVPEAAQYLRLSVGTMRNWLSQRRLECVKMGRRTLIRQAELDRLISANTIPAEDANAPL
jgi:excisionase family DNA binding protein